MIDKAKLLQWIEDKQYVFSPSALDSELDAAQWKGSRNVLSMLERDIENYEFDTDEEEPGPRFRMDENGNLTRIEE